MLKNIFNYDCHLPAISENLVSQFGLGGGAGVGGGGQQWKIAFKK